MRVERGVHAYIVETRPEELQSAIDITLRRYSEFQDAQGAFERRNAEALRGTELTLARQRHVLELYDGVVQGLAVAHLAHDLDRGDKSREALLGAFESARAIVNRSVEELWSEGVPLEQVIEGAAPGSADE